MNRLVVSQSRAQDALYVMANKAAWDKFKKNTEHHKSRMLSQLLPYRVYVNEVVTSPYFNPEQFEQRSAPGVNVPDAPVEETGEWQTPSCDNSQTRRQRDGTTHRLETKIVGMSNKPPRTMTVVRFSVQFRRWDSSNGAEVIVVTATGKPCR